jgi:Na+/glutamate symporter
MSLLVATWTGAVATVGLLIGAIVTSVFAIKAFRKQSEEVALLQAQVKDQQDDRAREAEERRRAQAAKIFVTASPGLSNIEIRMHNTSEQPI